MKYERDLQVRLRERYKRLFKTHFPGYFAQCGYLRDFVLKSHPLRAIVEHLERSEPDFDPAEWVATNFANRGYEWPPSEQARVKVVWYLINDLSNIDGVYSSDKLGRFFSGETSYDALNRAVTEQVFEPFIEYLEDQLGTESMALYHLDRLRQRIERFDLDDLYDQYKGDTKHGEEIYDRYMQRFLFDQGVEQVIAKARTASGEADAVANLDSEDALVVELKLYNGSSYDASYLRKGFNQAVQYAHDYAKTGAHLVVINLSEDNLQFESDQPSTVWPPRLHASGVTVYIVAIRAFPQKSASLRGNQKTVSIERSKLVFDE